MNQVTYLEIMLEGITKSAHGVVSYLYKKQLKRRGSFHCNHCNCWDLKSPAAGPADEHPKDVFGHSIEP